MNASPYMHLQRSSARAEIIGFGADEVNRALLDAAGL